MRLAITLSPIGVAFAKPTQAGFSSVSIKWSTTRSFLARPVDDPDCPSKRSVRRSLRRWGPATAASSNRSARRQAFRQFRAHIWRYTNGRMVEVPTIDHQSDPEAGCYRQYRGGILETSAGPGFKFLLICLGDSRSAFINGVCRSCGDSDSRKV
jgi:hypothetical protein